MTYTTKRLQELYDRFPETGRLLKPYEVGRLFSVDPKTVVRWAKQGRLTAVRTGGGHHRFKETEVRALLIACHGGSVVDEEIPESTPDGQEP